MPSLIPVAVFALCYVLFVVLPHRRSWVALCGAALLVGLGALTLREAFFDLIQWNVIGLFFGTLVLAELFMHSRMPAVIAEIFVDRTKTVRGALLALGALSGAISMFVENVAVVLLVAPIALSLADRLKISPVRLLIFIAISSNLQGTATLIGDPPSMILAGYMKMNFNDFFVYQHKPGIFFAVQIGAIASLLVMAYLLRAHKEAVSLDYMEKIKSWVPTVLLVILVVGLSFASVWDPDFRWFAGTLTLVLAALGIVWYKFMAKWGRTRELLKTLDWDTTLFLIGIFVIVGALSESGWLDVAAKWIAASVGKNLLAAFIAVLAISVGISAFVDNVPFLLAMIPVTQRVCDDLGVPVPILMFALLIGSCLGGNITPIGASANVVTVGLLRKRGYVVTFREFMAVGVPFTLAAVIASAIFVWFVWKP